MLNQKQERILSVLETDTSEVKEWYIKVQISKVQIEAIDDEVLVDFLHGWNSIHNEYSNLPNYYCHLILRTTGSDDNDERFELSFVAEPDEPNDVNVDEDHS